MDWLTQHIGEHEVKGDSDNLFIISLYKYGGLINQHENTPWCACCANAALVISGFKGTGSPAAKSFENYGTPCDFIYGSILPIHMPDGSMHVSFFAGWLDEKNKIAKCLGGNQADSLKISTFNLSGNDKGHAQVNSPRWPIRP